MDSEYEARERQEAFARTLEIERAPLVERKAARAAWFQAMKDPSHVAEVIAWIIDGNYGYGQMVQAREILPRKRMNREAALCQLAARYEWLCPGNFARDAWNDLSADEQKALSVAVGKIISDAEKEGV